jgi:hypothetical protein
MADAHDSKSCLARGGGSSPLSGTIFAKIKLPFDYLTIVKVCNIMLGE